MQPLVLGCVDLSISIIHPLTMEFSEKREKTALMPNDTPTDNVEFSRKSAKKRLMANEIKEF